MTDRLPVKYRTRIQIPKDQRAHMTFAQLDSLVEKLRGYAFVEVTTNNDKIPTSFLVELEAEDLYDLGMKVRDIQDELNSYDHSTLGWEVPRPEAVMA